LTFFGSEREREKESVRFFLAGFAEKRKKKKKSKEKL